MTLLWLVVENLGRLMKEGWQWQRERSDPAPWPLVEQRKQAWK